MPAQDKTTASGQSLDWNPGLLYQSFYVLWAMLECDFRGDMAGTADQAPSSR